MQLVHTVSEMRARVAIWRHDYERIALVPTMGNLHAGHLALVEAAQKLAERVLVSVFVNPTQFGPNEDFDRYPRTLQADVTALEAAGADLVFAPDVDEMYPGGTESGTVVEVPGLSDILCGAARPGHFRGVTTVVARLFNMAQPDRAFFGEKDYQQLLVIRRMVRDLSIPVDVRGVDIVREADGLAMSSRNQYLSEPEREIAPQLYRRLAEVAAALRGGNRDYAGLEQAAMQHLAEAGFAPEYVAIRRAEDLAEPRHPRDALRVLGAARLGSARLIDNLAAEPA